MAESAKEAPIPRWRVWTTYAVMLVLLVLFVARLYQLQVIEGEVYQALADENRFQIVNVPAPRGVMYDRNGSLLVRNIPSFNVYITPAFLPDSPAEVEAIYRKLSELTDVPVDQEGPPAAPCVPGRGIRQLVLEGQTNRPFDAWPIACDVDPEVARILREWQVDMAGVSVEAVPVRDYATGDLTAHIIGYLGPIPESLAESYREQGFDISRDKIGYAGLEAWYQDTLAGQNGQIQVEIDVAGQRVREYGTVIQPRPGNNLRLTIDTRLQAAAETALINRMGYINRLAGEERTPIGVVIAIDPQTGEILALVSIPTYENNRFARFIPVDYYQQLEADERGKPLINHAISIQQPPGSTFKMVTALGILNEDVISPTRTLFDPGLITIFNQYFPNDPGKAKEFVCWKEDGHGDVAYLTAIAQSCNIYFYKVGGGYQNEIPGDGLGVERIGQYARALGYGNPLGIDLPGEEDGLIPDPDWKRINLGENWSTGDTYNATTGQGFVLATPLQVLNAISTIANGGRVMQPHLLKEVLDGEGNVIETIQPSVLWDISDGVITSEYDLNIDPSVIQLAREGMRLVVEEGTADGYADLENISSGGKTGTGEFCDEVVQAKNLCVPGNWPTHSWYVGFAPWENPEIAVVAFVYHGGEGAVTSGPVVREVLEVYFELKSLEAGQQPG
jgi:penicillin-binding protein 2